MKIEGLNPRDPVELVFSSGAKITVTAHPAIGRPRLRLEVGTPAPDGLDNGFTDISDPFAGEEVDPLSALPYSQQIPMTEKDRLLTHYATKEPTRFIQIDLFANTPEDNDGIMRPDDEGDCMLGGVTTELMHGATVRVLIQPGTEPETVSRILLKIAKSIDRQGLWPEEAKHSNPFIDKPPAPLGLDQFTPGDSREE